MTRMDKINEQAEVLRDILGTYSPRPYAGHRFYSERYDDKLLATIALNREGKWTAEDQQAALEILAYLLDYPRR